MTLESDIQSLSGDKWSWLGGVLKRMEVDRIEMEIEKVWVEVNRN